MSVVPKIDDHANLYAPEQPERTEWDAIVVGTGMGGATAGYELARLGRRVLFVEKGLFLHGRLHADPSGLPSAAAFANAPGDVPEERLRVGRWPSRLQGRTTFGDIEFFAPLGCGSGGSTTLYAAGLERFAPSDFRPRANFPNVPDSTLPERWPITYDDLRPYYERAEDLYEVRGTPDPLHRAGPSVLRAPPPLSPRDRYLFDSLERSDLHPYRPHVGCAYVDGCTGCVVGPCPRECKSDAARICLVPALEKFGARLLAECEVVEIEADRVDVRAVRCEWRGRRLSLRAKVIVLAAGAYMTPTLLLKSRSEAWPDGVANRSGLVGRNLMFHVSDFFAVVPKDSVAGYQAGKSLAFNDLYHSNAEKLGTFQSTGAQLDVGRLVQYIRDVADQEQAWWLKLAGSRPRWWRRVSTPAVRLAATAMYHLLDFKSAAIWASIIEDLPYRHNRVVLDARASNGMRFEYCYAEELRNRVLSFRRRLAQALAPHKTVLLSRENNLNFGHACGTCRFGTDAASSVLDSNNRAHDLSNLYVVDASFFPSSGGTNPSLTIAANALRVAAAISARLRDA